jgi:hypothetical protein
MPGSEEPRIDVVDVEKLASISAADADHGLARVLGLTQRLPAAPAFWAARLDRGVEDQSAWGAVSIADRTINPDSTRPPPRARASSTMVGLPAITVRRTRLLVGSGSHSS